MVAAREPGKKIIQMYHAPPERVHNAPRHRCSISCSGVANNTRAHLAQDLVHAWVSRVSHVLFRQVLDPLANQRLGHVSFLSRGDELAHVVSARDMATYRRGALGTVLAGRMPGRIYIYICWEVDHSFRRSLDHLSFFLGRGGLYMKYQERPFLPPTPPPTGKRQLGRTPQTTQNQTMRSACQQRHRHGRCGTCRRRSWC
jgi:hypothetical protein